MATKKIVIVGAGPGGLASAMQLAKAGCDVTVLERRDRVGGRTSAIHQDGFRFDCGPTFFLYPRVLTEIFASCGYDLMDECPMQRLDIQYRLTFGGGGVLDCSADMDEMDRQIAQISPGDVGALRRYIDDNRVKLERFRPILESPFSSPMDLLRPSVLAAALYVNPQRSLGRELQRYFQDPRLVIAFAFQSKYLGMSPFNCPSLFSILSFLEYEHGVYHPMGGCSRVSEVMADLARSMGVKVHLDQEVRSVELQGRRLKALHTNDERYEADSFVINADFADWISKNIPNAMRRRWSDQQLAKKRYSCSTYMLYLGIDGLYEDLPHHNIYISSDYEQNLCDIEHDHVLSDDPSVYVQNACVTDPSLAPHGQSTLYVLVPVTHEHANVDWSVHADPLREKTLDQLAKIGLTDVRDRIRTEHRITPVDWKKDYAIYRGATFNLAHNLGQMLHRRPQNRFEELDGVYLVGGGTHPGSGLPVIYESSRITSRLLLSDLGISTDFIDASATGVTAKKPAVAAMVPA
ncbi:phytoene desaturase [Crateriforma conspicua]|uniref:All-trans-zeta-carotene desaturase n=1 Tax=Crateriforma conspicua TaxID=2527996 RepID=A0A5C5Y414_9PLAN|nr:phytoene desaturase [Crateriforma conspicua]QDV64506.1 All-trans-zeta-carotene desaturase [Crateriforma conspicua]TWT69904.1 All-trans-zeta-carotene desaturase [Crateriforma conspicua]